MDDLEARVIDAEPMVLACAPDHRLAAESGIQLTEVDGESFVDFISHWGSREQADRMLAKQGSIASSPYK